MATPACPELRVAGADVPADGVRVESFPAGLDGAVGRGLMPLLAFRVRATPALRREGTRWGARLVNGYNTAEVPVRVADDPSVRGRLEQALARVVAAGARCPGRRGRAQIRHLERRVRQILEREARSKIRRVVAVNPNSLARFPGLRDETWLWLYAWCGGFKLRVPVPVVTEAPDPRAGPALSCGHDTFCGVEAAHVTPALFAAAVGAGVWDVPATAGATDAAGAAARPVLLLLVPAALAGAAPAALVLRQSEVWQWLKVAATDPELARSLALCPVRGRPYAGQVDRWRALAARGAGSAGSFVATADFGPELAFLHGALRTRARWEATEFGAVDTTRAPPGSLLHDAVNSVALECAERERRRVRENRERERERERRARAAGHTAH